ncbi:MAG: alpha/beta hydrolase-fold protein, partial [Planctomycetota bacterium]
MLDKPGHRFSRWVRVLFFAAIVFNGYLVWREFGKLRYDRWAETRQAEGKHGFVPRTLIQADGQYHKYLVYVPHVRAPEEGFPVILMLNGLGENGDDGFVQLINNGGRPVWEMQEAFPFLVVAPQCPKESSWQSDAEPIAMGAFEKSMREYDVDPNQVIITGASAGGSAALHLGTKYPDRFSAIVPVSASPNAVKEIAK